jgi:uncharacterized protein YaaR (DUF327 family)
MDKIDFPHGIERFLNAGTQSEARKTKEKAGPRRREFNNFLECQLLESGELGPLSEISPSDEAVQELIDEVQSTGNDLKRRPLADELLRYKKAVRNFLHYVVENSYELRELQGIVKKTVIRGKTEWKTTIFHQVRVIDQKLNQLAADIITKHISELDLQSKIEEITGLLVDLTVTGKIRERDE